MNSGRTALTFLTGIGVGVALALLFAPQSGEETREWLGETAEDGIKQIRKTGRRTLNHLQDTVSRAEEKVTKVIRTGKDVLGTISAKLD
jgi:gas vesicle protein